MFQHKYIWTYVCLIFVAQIAWAQKNEFENKTTYVSQADELLTIKSISVLPTVDNVKGIYSRPIEKHLSNLISENHKWDLVPLNSIGPIYSPEELTENTTLLKKMTDNLKSDAVVSSRVSKGPRGIAIKLTLFLLSDSKVISEEYIDDYKQFELDGIKRKVSEMFNKLTHRIPYQGMVLSRQGNRVTVNLGLKDGINSKTVISAIQILKIKRHPKFQFLISSEKEIIGKIRLIKVDETLSFGKIISEKGRGAIRKNTKVSGVDFVKYTDSFSLGQNSADENQLLGRPDGDISFGKDAKHWVPTNPPKFGQLGARFGLGQYTGNTNVGGGVGSLDASNSLYPTILIDGELWLTPNWTVHLGLRQGIVPVDNPRSGSSPGELSQSLTSYDFTVGYKFRLSPSVWGNYVELLTGFSSYKLFVDDSTARAFTTMEYNGFKFGAEGYMPVSKNKKWGAGAKFFFFLNPNLKETPVTSGASNDNTVNQFGLFGTYKLGERTKILGSLDFELYSSKFSGTGTRTNSATSSSQRHTSLTGGIYYMF